VRIEPRRHGQFRLQPVLLDRFADASRQQIAIAADLMAHPFSAPKSRHVLVGYSREPGFPPMMDHAHQVTGEAFNQPIRAEIPEPFIFQGGCERTHPGPVASHRHHADHGAEYEPGRRRIVIGAIRPCEASAADQAAVEADCIRPFDGDRCSRRRY